MALCYLILRYLVHAQHAEPHTFRLTGANASQPKDQLPASPAASLDFLLGKNTGWLAEMFGTDGQGRSQANKFIRRHNPEGKRKPDFFELSIQTAVLPAANIQVLLQEELASDSVPRAVTDLAELKDLCVKIESQWAAKKPGYDRECVGAHWEKTVGGGPVGGEVVPVASSSHRDEAAAVRGGPETPNESCCLRLPATGSEFVGRGRELRLLNEAWARHQLHIVAISGWGGRGKTALVNEWLAQLAQRNFRGIPRVFAWSFYRRSSSGRAGSVDEFLDRALAELGDAVGQPGSSTEKADRLLRLLRAKPTLFILDGIETIQFPPGPDGGRLKEPTVALLLRELAAVNPGLCVLTTRIPVADLASWQATTCRAVRLSPLSSQQGGKLLRRLGVTGSALELCAASGEYGGEPLALNLLGNQLRMVFQGDVHRRGDVSLLAQDRSEGGHAERVIAAYEAWFGEGKELALLRIVSLFESEVEDAALRRVIAEPAIPGLTSALVNLPPTEIEHALTVLQDTGLLHRRTRKPRSTGASRAWLETHHVVRDYFRHGLKEANPAAFRQANARLFAFFQTATERFPGTNRTMAPLYAAVMHGCAAGKHRAALEQVFRRRIQREGRPDANYATKKLGAISSVLASLSCFFKTPFEVPAVTLDEQQRAYVLNYAGFILRAQGHLSDSVRAYARSLAIRRRRGEWADATEDGTSLAEVQSTLGQLFRAHRTATSSLRHADLSGNSFWRTVARATAAQVAHSSGDFVSARRLFTAAEAIQGAREPETPLLYSVHG